MAGDDKNNGPVMLGAWREWRGLTQEDLAEEIGTTGSMVSMLETGERGLTVKWLRRISPVLRASPGDLIDVQPGVPVDKRVPSESELAIMLENAQREVPMESLTVGGYPSAVASALRTQLLQFASAGANGLSGKVAKATGPEEGAQSPRPTKRASRV